MEESVQFEMAVEGGVTISKFCLFSLWITCTEYIQKKIRGGYIRLAMRKRNS